jgi:predicted metalloprotease with PDZ domain
MNAGAQEQPDDMVAQASHEFFHIWNVKRIRPVQMWPYDYARENETPLLWISEGFTTYYERPDELVFGRVHLLQRRIEHLRVVDI